MRAGAKNILRQAGFSVRRFFVIFEREFPAFRPRDVAKNKEQ
jgi:hypothetical protein